MQSKDKGKFSIHMWNFILDLFKISHQNSMQSVPILSNRIYISHVPITMIHMQFDAYFHCSLIRRIPDKWQIG